ncbi:hypothetical protein HII36_01970 [Nonomuraea sp. NN258]|uniref:hypothetical protein n=1 Tax=Nonomuraea antri TaxID=2730852 RepID=UPI00156A0475|nr:hypothetical protein [Nonomuraea antri]NRQ30612.1 hypothetical protein [Nonomuraea antri]
MRLNEDPHPNEPEEIPSQEQCWEEFWKVAAYVLANIERRRHARQAREMEE